MEYPSAKVKNVFNNLSKKKSTLNSQEVNEEIQELSEDERCQLFWLIYQTNKMPLEILSKEFKLWDGIKALFIGDYSSTGLLNEQNGSILELAEIGVYMGSLTLEDFRSVARFLYTHALNYNLIVDQINEIIVRLLANITTSNEDIIAKLSTLIRYMGLPPSGFDRLCENLLVSFPGLISEIKKLKELPIDTCQHYPGLCPKVRHEKSQMELSACNSNTENGQRISTSCDRKLAIPAT